MAIFGFDTFRVKLYAVNRMNFVGQAHNQPILCFSGNFKTVRQTVSFHNQRMIACGPERIAEAPENCFITMVDITDLAVHQVRGADHPAAVNLANGLMAETDAQNG